MRTVYVVMGTTGEYSDRDEWAVCAYTSEDSAKTHVERATARARELFERIRASVYFDYNEMAAFMGELDPGIMLRGYTGTRYFYYAVDVRPVLEETVKA